MGIVTRSLGLLLLAGALAAVTSCAESDGLSTIVGGLPAYGLITAEQAVRVLAALSEEPDFVLLDIRTPAEVAAGHLPGATQLDFRSGTFADDLATLDPNATYLIYCRTANRTGQAYRMMSDLGFDKVYDLDGGITRWSQLGYPTCVGEPGDEHVCSGEVPDLAALP
ncbi:MAG: rhodanese-like domain-containing protein [Candidatus Bipolaricaulota bacterium]|nr:MAG: rhodanese-like domain-containing protein [Candidatus Bipolaricaulota bacterium]